MGLTWGSLRTLSSAIIPCTQREREVTGGAVAGGRGTERLTQGAWHREVKISGDTNQRERCPVLGQARAAPGQTSGAAGNRLELTGWNPGLSSLCNVTFS